MMKKIKKVKKGVDKGDKSLILWVGTQERVKRIRSLKTKQETSIQE